MSPQNDVNFESFHFGQLTPSTPELQEFSQTVSLVEKAMMELSEAINRVHESGDVVVIKERSEEPVSTDDESYWSDDDGDMMADVECGISDIDHDDDDDEMLLELLSNGPRSTLRSSASVASNLSSNGSVTGSVEEQGMDSDVENEDDQEDQAMMPQAEISCTKISEKTDETAKVDNQDCAVMATVDVHVCKSCSQIQNDDLSRATVEMRSIVLLCLAVLALTMSVAMHVTSADVVSSSSSSSQLTMAAEVGRKAGMLDAIGMMGWQLLEHLRSSLHEGMEFL